ncbi:MAG: extracellular solute-binding protein [Holophagales bacterium]|nr:extracellular solute-binding protein [Holophagales bacterium]
MSQDTRAVSRIRLTVLAGLLLAVLSSPLLAQTELVVWHGYRGAEKAAFEKVIEAYNAEMGGKVKVKTLAVPYDAYPDKITAAVPRGKGPDLFIFAQDRMGGWVEAGNTIEPIDFYLDDDLIGRFIGTTMEAMTYQGTVYGLPLNYKVVTQIYNKKLVPSPPTTSAELVATAKKLTDAAVGKFGLAYPYNDYYYHAALMNAFGGGVFDAKGQPVVDQKANVDALEYMMKWFEKDGILPAEPSTALITSLFNEGKAAIVFSGPWFLGEVADSVDVGLAPLPKIDEAGAPMKPWMTVEGVFVAAPSKHKDEAFDLAVYLTDFEAAKVLALEGRQTPANKAVYDDPALAADAVLQAFREQVKVAVPMPNVPEMTMMWSPVTTAMNLIVKGSSSPAAAMVRAQAEVKERIAALRQ